VDHRAGLGVPARRRGRTLPPGRGRGRGGREDPHPPIDGKIIELDPEFLTPYLLERRGSSTVAHLALVEAGIRAGQEDGSIRAGDADWLVAADHPGVAASAVSGPVLAEAAEYPKLDEELRAMLTRYLVP